MFVLGSFHPIKYIEIQKLYITYYNVITLKQINT